MTKKSTLLIVESPAKAKTIEHYLGKGYSVEASVGHLIDLPKSRIAIDVDHGFEPEYITVRGKASILKELEKKAAKADEVLLASDNDREGEAISYHLKCALESKKIPAKIERIIFNEITPAAIKAAVNAPRDIDMGKVNAQKARRVLDRIVGYNLSPILWKKVKNGLSAGRVQSVALKLICDREKEVLAFKAEEYWSLDVELKKGKGSFLAQLVPQNEDKIMFHTKAEVDAFMAGLAGKKYIVTDIKTVDKILNPRAPYTTSKLQQEAAIRLGFTSKKTMQLAQQLYEGISLGSNRVGLITYMRTDSTRISNQALADVRDYIGKNFPQALPEHFNNYSLGKRAQDAHEAIRPTYVKYTPDSVKQYLTSDQLKLYTIIWERFVSSQMKDSVLAVTTVDIDCGGKPFRTIATVVKEKGFQAVLKLLAIKEKAVHLPAIAAGDELEYCKYETEQHFTQGPSRYTDASIVKVLEEKGIGRPSTYAPIITLLIERYYVARKNKQLIPTQLGNMVNDMLVKYFSDILEVNFTADMEQKLDDVEESKDNWSKMIEDFYKPFKEQVDNVMATLESQRGSMDELTEYKCDKCGRPMVKKLGRFGHFLACSGFPECKNTQSIPFCKCPVPGCDGHIVARKKHGGKGREFYGCTNYPKCDFISAHKPTSKICPECGYFMVDRYEKGKGSFSSCSNPECKNYVKEE